MGKLRICAVLVLLVLIICIPAVSGSDRIIDVRTYQVYPSTGNGLGFIIDDTTADGWTAEDGTKIRFVREDENHWYIDGRNAKSDSYYRNIDGSEYELRLSVLTSSPTVERKILILFDGDGLDGRVTLPTDEVRYYLFGTERFAYGSIPVESDRFSFNCSGLQPGEYWVVLQHPGKNGIFNIGPSESMRDIRVNLKGAYETNGAVLLNAETVHGKKAADILSRAFGWTGVDDCIAMKSFSIQENNRIPDVETQSDEITVAETTAYPQSDTKPTIPASPMPFFGCIAGFGISAAILSRSRIIAAVKS